MRKGKLITSLILTVAIAAIATDLTKTGYMEFTTISDIQSQFPNFTSPQFATILNGNDKGCLTSAKQTQKVSLQQIRTLRQLASPDEAQRLLGNAYCQTATGLKYLTESGQELTVKFNNILDYDFSSGAANKTMLTRSSKDGMARAKKTAKTR